MAGTVWERLVAVLAVAALAGGCAAPAPGVLAASSGLPDAVAPVGAAAPTGDDDGPSLADDRAAVEVLLDGLAGAFLAGDPEALRPLLHDPSGPFGQRWLGRAEAMGTVPLSSYDLALDPSLPDLTTADRPGDGGLLVSVVERHGILGAEVLGDAEERLFLTLRRRDGSWTVAGDEDAEDLGLLSVDHLWDHGPVEVARRGDITLLHHPGQAGVQTLLDETAIALDRARARWPNDWPGEAVLIVPADEEELAELLHVSFSLENFIAFATSTGAGTLGRVELTGARVLLNTGRFLSRTAETRRSILTHELVHVASRPTSAGLVPSWLEEGVAQVLGEQRSTTGTALLSSTPTDRLDLPLDAEFTAGTRDETFLSYQLAWSFVDHLVRSRGADAVGAFYAAAGRGSQQSVGTAAARVDAAAQRVLGLPLEDLLAEWRAAR